MSEERETTSPADLAATVREAIEEAAGFKDDRRVSNDDHAEFEAEREGRLAALDALQAQAEEKQYPDGLLEPYDAACLRADEAEERAEAAEAERDRLKMAKNNWHSAYIAERRERDRLAAEVWEQVARTVDAQEERDRLREWAEAWRPERERLRARVTELEAALRQIVARLPSDDDPYDGTANTVIGPLARAALTEPAQEKQP